MKTTTFVMIGVCISLVPTYRVARTISDARPQTFLVNNNLRFSTFDFSTFTRNYSLTAVHTDARLHKLKITLKFKAI